MGKQGPCYHCGVTSTPLWRNGPPEKPVLCNACGSRWRTKGTLANYTPQHRRDGFELDIPKKPKEKSTLLKIKVRNVKKGPQSDRMTEEESGIGDYGQSSLKGIDEETSNRSSSGSAMSSYSESCANFNGGDMSEVTGSFQSNVWEMIVPSRKRTGIIHPKRSAVEKLAHDLHSIMNEQSSYLTMSSEEDLLYDCDTPTGLIEIGNGSVLIRHPSSALKEEESDASSLPLQNKSTSAGLSLMTDCQSKISAVPNMCNSKIKTSPTQDQSKRDKTSHERLHMLHKDSKLGFIDLGDIFCFEGYMKYLTDEERKQLMRYLPFVDTSNPPESLETMFTSSQFVESLSYFQNLLQQGIFDLSTSEIKSDECKKLRKLILSNLTKAVWIESFKTLKEIKDDATERKKGVKGGTTFPSCSSAAPPKRTREIHNDNFAEPVDTKSLKTPFNIMRPGLPPRKLAKRKSGESGKNPQIEFSNCIGSNDSNDNPESRPWKSHILDSLQLTGRGPDEDVLLDIRSSTSFPEAELLSDAWLQNSPAKILHGESGVSGKEGSILCQSGVSFSSNPPKQW